MWNFHIQEHPLGNKATVCDIPTMRLTDLNRSLSLHCSLDKRPSVVFFSLALATQQTTRESLVDVKKCG
jgi:hypothetical protein